MLRFLTDELFAAERKGERVWILGTEAQRASWVPDLYPHVQPWYLTIHAYTSMLRCYVNESTKGVRRKGDEELYLWSSGDQRVRGFGRFIKQRRKLAHLTRIDVVYVLSQVRGSKSSCREYKILLM